MSESLEQKRKFLIVDANEEARKTLTKKIEKRFANSYFIYAADGSDAFMRINNDPPHILIVENNVTKMTCHDLVNVLLADKKYDDLAIIIVAEIPDRDFFVEAVGMGRVQFLDRPDDEKKLVQCLSRALNYLTHKDKAEFHLRFLVEGEELIKEGDKADNVYLVKRGTLKASVKRNGQEIFYGMITPGEFVGEMAYINGEPRVADVTVTSDCELIEIPINYLDHVLFQKPVWSKALMKTLSRRVKVANQNKN